MKRMHIHVRVAELEPSIRFYSTLFGIAPSVLKPDYAKWMLDDPRLNFAISHREHATGIDHLGLQAENEAELQELTERLKSADLALFAEGKVACCYAQSEKAWVKDPQGIAWETFHTFGEATTYSVSAEQAADRAQTAASCGESSACCGPQTEAVAEKAVCCG